MLRPNDEKPAESKITQNRVLQRPSAGSIEPYNGGVNAPYTKESSRRQGWMWVLVIDGYPMQKMLKLTFGIPLLSWLAWRYWDQNINMRERDFGDPRHMRREKPVIIDKKNMLL
ncbi:hypothetical protein PV327_003114 [Microctonus hyperodae]|uniref:Uncharacterized protein n=1 Tax=Microctonus hyperodae TaxID=165561 RepID=A0AA39G3M3_MICHY|nr:hypothetical protein PV327_003114 [Microctonus hyperodae]